MELKKWIYYWQFEAWLDCFIYNNRYILRLRRDYRSVSKAILFLTSPYLLINWLFSAVYALTVGRYRVIRQLRKEKLINFPYEVAIVAIAKNEGLYIREWIEFHKLKEYPRFIYMTMKAMIILAWCCNHTLIVDT